MTANPIKLVEGLHKFISKSVGLDVLDKQKYTFSKQVDNFGDSLAMTVKNVFESTGLYKTITGATVGFNTGFSAISGNKDFLNYVGSMFTPYQSRLDKAISEFSGINIGTYKTMPMSQLVEAMERNFENLSMDEIGQRFEGLITNMGDI